VVAVPAVPVSPPLAKRLIVALAGLTLLLHVVANLLSPYGFHRDELLYLAMGRHLDLWRMDFPPLIALVAEATRGLLGDSLVAIRLVPALAGASLVVMAALLAREFGGGLFAQTLAMLCVLAHPLFLRAANLFQPVVLDQLWWTVGFLALARLGRDASPRWWLLLGVAGGLGLLTKFSILFFGVAVLAALLATPLRRALAGPWPWVAAGIALAIGHPSIVGQIALDWPLRLQLAGLREAQLERLTWAEFLGTQFLFGPATLGVALVGLAALLASPGWRAYRAVGWAALGSFVILLVLRGKPYYAGPVYPAVCAAGAVVIAGLPWPRAAAALRWASATLVVLYGGVLTLPLGLPVLPPPVMARYAERLGVTAAVQTNRGERLELPQDYADMLGWEAQVVELARVYRSLPPVEREAAVIIAGNYGEAGAIDFLGRRHGLPGAISPAGTYWQFGPGEKPGAVAVTIGVDRGDLLEYYDSVVTVGHVNEPWVVTEERNLQVNVARRPRETLQAVWGRVGPHYQ
jgi:hypothetical protein